MTVALTIVLACAFPCVSVRLYVCVCARARMSGVSECGKCSRQSGIVEIDGSFCLLLLFSHRSLLIAANAGGARWPVGVSVGASAT